MDSIDVKKNSMPKPENIFPEKNWMMLNMVISIGLFNNIKDNISNKNLRQIDKSYFERV